MERPQTGALFIVHAIIVSIKWVRRHPASALIVLNVSALVFLSTWQVLSLSIEDRSTLAFVGGIFTSCEYQPDSLNKNTIILRLDDVESYTWGVTEMMITDTLNRGIPLTLGVIPLHLENNSGLVDLIQDRRCDLEIALHGWNHRGDIPEFSGIGKGVAFDKLKRGKMYLEELFGVEVITFIPPQNVISRKAEGALSAAGFKILSSEGVDYLDYDVSTYDFPNKRVVPTSEVIEKCTDAFIEDNVCVIMLHPQDYATDEVLDTEKYTEYTLLLDELEKLDTSFITFKNTQ